MIHDEFPSVALHNVAETEAPEWTSGGRALRRVPRSVGEELNVAARDRMRHPAGSEIRFVPREPIEVTLSAADPVDVWPFWGPFQGQEVVEIGPEPRTIELPVPERVANLRDDVDAGRLASLDSRARPHSIRPDAGPFDPRVCRLRFEMGTPVAIHGVSGDCRPPRDEELPDRRYLAHGTSITEGADASGPHLTYVSQAARAASVDPINLGASGSAFCEPAMAEHVAERDDWDVATLSLSVNMANRGFTLAQFEEHVERFVATVAEANPEKPVVCVTLFPYHADAVAGDDADRARAFRRALREAADGHANASVVEGPDLTDATGLTTDLLHPGDAGMTAIADGLASEIEAALA
ncbi:GDSL-type esterase/lipase family protein [Halomicrobium urmianum]|uniref:GDSL-type esterase/lipase family protein n=1 Tax=Halomicrobium urmianum TaxID=1586233 RepID=UPI001CDA172D|nr:GDSL-type esterase/lipase family protein [Halomicrobium urmianum]